MGNLHPLGLHFHEGYCEGDSMRASFVDAWRWWCDMHPEDENAVPPALGLYDNCGFNEVFFDIELAYIALQAPKMADLNCIGDLIQDQKIIDSFNIKSLAYSPALTAYAMALDAALARYIAATIGENADAFRRLPRAMIVSQLCGLFEVDGLAMSFPELQDLTYEEGEFLAAVGDLHDALLARQGGNTEAAYVYLVRAAQYGAFSRSGFEKRRKQSERGKNTHIGLADIEVEIISLANKRHVDSPDATRPAVAGWLRKHFDGLLENAGIDDLSLTKLLKVRNKEGFSADELLEAAKYARLLCWVSKSNIPPQNSGNSKKG